MSESVDTPTTIVQAVIASAASVELMLAHPIEFSGNHWLFWMKADTPDEFANSILEVAATQTLVRLRGLDLKPA